MEDLELVREKFIQWLKDHEKMEYKLADICKNNNGEIEIVKEMAWMGSVTLHDWETFVKETGIKCDRYELLAFL